MISDQLLQVGASRVVADSICWIKSQLRKILLQYASFGSDFLGNTLTLCGFLFSKAAEATRLSSLL
jgi:hypothetical protein